MTNPYKVLIADGLAGEGIAQLKNNPQIELLEFSAIDRDELKAKLPQIDILIVRSRTQVNRDLLAAGARLKIVIRAGIGLDNIEVPAATERGIVVMNAPTGNIVTTAEHTLALIFGVSRHLAQADASLRQGKWEKKKFQGNELRRKTLGIIGLGNIGKAVAERALGLSMKVIGYDPYLSPDAAARHQIKLVALDELFRHSDYITVHVPLSDGTRHLVGREAFAKMKKGAYVINCARGGVVDEVALIEALDSGTITGAALDVFETEPLPVNSPWLSRQDVLLTPHLGASTDEAQVQVGLEVAEQIEQFLEKGAFKNAINVPNITMEQMDILRPHLQLGERLGSFAAQIAPAHQCIHRVKIAYQGAITAANQEILTLSLLKGFLTPLLSTTVNYVNAKNLLRDRGIRLEESFDASCENYSSLIGFTIEAESDRLTVCGTLFGKSEPRIVAIDNYSIDAIPSGCLLFTKNVDQPGVIGALGSLLANHGINIARMHLGRETAKNAAIALINVDSQIPDVTLEALRQIKGMLSARQIKL